MGVYHLLAIVAAALPLQAFAPVRLPRRPSIVALRWLAIVCALTLGGATIAYFTVFGQAVVELPSRAVQAGLPVVFFDISRGEAMAAARADELLALVVVECLSLAGLVFGLPAFDKPARAALIGTVACSLACSALIAHAADSPDPYLYVGIATLGLHAYAPPNVPFPGDLHVINAIWGTPLFPSAYGPFWVALSAAALGAVGTLGGKLIALRAIGLVSVGVCAWFARRLGAPTSVVAAILCNPALYAAYVADAHNDLIAVDAVLAAMLAARKNVWASFPLALVAALVKLTLAPVALVALVGIASLRTRVAFAATLVGAIVAAYTSFDGTMWHALYMAERAYAHPAMPLDGLTRAALVAIGFGISAWIVVARSARVQGAWAFASFGDYPLPQYLIWGLPLALLEEPIALLYLVTLPFLAFLQGPVLPATPLCNWASTLSVVAVIIAITVRLLEPKLRQRYIL